MSTAFAGRITSSSSSILRLSLALTLSSSNQMLQMEKAVACLSFLALCLVASAYPSSSSYLDDSKLSAINDGNNGIYLGDPYSDEVESDERIYAYDDNRDFDGVLELLEDAPKVEVSAPHLRLRRQTSAMNLASDHSTASGRDRPVGQIHGLFRPSGSGSLQNYNIGATAGLGSVVWRSPNRQHSLGLGATVDHTRGSSGGIRFQSPLNVGAGIGYRWRF